MLWHPDRLRQATSLPAVRTFQQSLGDDAAQAYVPKPFAEQAATEFREQTNITIEPFDLPLGAVGDAALSAMAKTWGLRPNFDEFDRGVFALAFTYLALTAVLQNMGQDDPIDDWSIWRDLETALRFGEDEPERRRDSLQAAHETLYAARNLVFPSSVNLL